MIPPPCGAARAGTGLCIVSASSPRRPYGTERGSGGRQLGKTPVDDDATTLGSRRRSSADSTIARSTARSRVSTPASTGSLALYDELDIRATDHASRPTPTSPRSKPCSTRPTSCRRELRPVTTYLYALITTDSRDDAPRLSPRRAADPRRAARARSAKRLGAWLAALDVDELRRAQPAAAEHAFALREGRRGRRAPDERAGGVAGGRARAVGLARVAAAARRRLVAADGRGARRRRRRSSACRWRSPAGWRRIPTPARRRAAYEGELAAWATVAVPLAAALNGAKGELGVLNRRRGFADDLEPALRAQQRRPRDARRDDRRGRRVAARLPPLPARQGDGCSATTAGCRGGICSRRSATRRRRSRGRARPTRVRDAFARLLARSRRRSRTERVRPSSGSTPRSATASAAARTAWASTATSAA